MTVGCNKITNQIHIQIALVNEAGITDMKGNHIFY